MHLRWVLILGMALGPAACGQGLQLWPAAKAPPAVVVAPPPAPERRIDLVAEGSHGATVLYAVLLDAQKAALPGTALHALRTINATGLSWPHYAPGAATLAVFEDVDGDGLCNAACGDHAWQVALTSEPAQHYPLATQAAAPDGACAAFAGLHVDAGYTLRLVADPNAPQASEVLQVKVTSQKDDTTSTTATSAVVPQGGVWTIPLNTSVDTVSTTVNATGATLQLALPLGQVLGDQALAIPSGDTAAGQSAAR